MQNNPDGTGRGYIKLLKKKGIVPLRGAFFTKPNRGHPDCGIYATLTLADGSARGEPLPKLVSFHRPSQNDGMLDPAAFNPAWITLSIAMSSEADPLSVPEVQQLGRLDSNLAAQERLALEVFRTRQSNDDTLRHGFLIGDILGGSWLWVLGAYEVFRRAKNRREGVTATPEFASLNEQISEIRIVLAKREARSNGKVKQLPGALFSPEGAVGWRYWDRHGHEQRFYRATFAAAWLASAPTLHAAALSHSSNGRAQ